MKLVTTTFGLERYCLDSLMKEKKIKTKIIESTQILIIHIYHNYFACFIF